MWSQADDGGLESVIVVSVAVNVVSARPIELTNVVQKSR